MHDDIIDRVEIVLTLKKLLLLCQQTIETNCNWHGRSSFNLKETNCYSVNKKIETNCYLSVYNCHALPGMLKICGLVLGNACFLENGW
jgi:hypothetical protein